MRKVSENWMGEHGIRLSVDIGGTFTDVVLLSPKSAQPIVSKVLTTPAEPAQGVMDGVAKACARGGVQLADVVELAHGTTLVTNAVIERKGARTALVTTEGFRDLVEMARETSYDSYDLYLSTPEPLVPRHWRLTIRERTSANGDLLATISKEDVVRVCDVLRAQAIESVAVCFINSFKNATNERLAEEWIRAELPEIAISSSSEIAPEIREYERFTTATINAYTKPLTVQYIDHLDNRFRKEGFTGRFYMMLSNGGVIHATAAKDYPVRLIESGPAAGALAVALYSELTRHNSIIGFDMGGTTAKVTIVDALKPWVTTELEVARAARFKKGSGLPLKVPTVDLIEIGAGGGSIARVDQRGLLKIGPDSASSTPGPACYGRGGQLPTVTDADLLLGLLNPIHFAGGEMALDRDAAETSMKSLANNMGLSTSEVAQGIFEIVNENMASAARIHITERGRDPRSFAMVAFGGAGPLHAYDLALRLGVGKVIVPMHSGVASAVGLLTASVKLDYVQTYATTLADADWERVARMFIQMEQQLSAQLSELGSRCALTRSVDARFVGQGYELTFLLPTGELGPHSVADIQRRFLQEYEVVFGQRVQDMPVEILNWRVSLLGPEPGRFLAKSEKQRPASGAPQPNHQREVKFPGQAKFVDCPVYRHADLIPGDRFAGPCLVELNESTSAVGPGGIVEVDDYLNLVITLPPLRSV